jgi:CTP:molybdopterin cytidylyltransferase MocA
MHKLTVSILLTCGIAEHFPKSYSVKSKALLPINGHFLFEYVLKALCNSNAEKVFVIQESNQHLEIISAYHEKVVYANCPSVNPSIADSLVCALETLIDFYGENELHKRYVMFVPCDIPLVKSEDFDILMAQNNDAEVDIYVPFIKYKVISTVFPEHHFRSIYFRDLGRRYSPQGLALASGRLFKTGKINNDSNRVDVCDRSGHLVLGLKEIINDIRHERGSLLGWLRFFSLLLWIKLIKQGQTTQLLQLIYSYFSNKLTVSLLEQSLERALNVKVAFIETQSAAFSVDIDTPNDLQNVKVKLNVIWEKEPAIIKQTLIT